MKINKGIELTNSQIKSLENGATMFIFPIISGTPDINKFLGELVGIGCYDVINYLIHYYSPIQKDDKVIFVKEELSPHGDGIVCYCSEYEEDIWEELRKGNCLVPASQMTKEQSRYSFSECIDVKVVRVQDINILQTSPFLGWWCKTKEDFSKYYNKQMNELGINRTYNDNDYVFLVEFKR